MKTTITDSEKHELFTRAKKMFETDYKSLGSGFGMCAYWAVCAVNVLAEAGYKPIIQAGSLSWPILEKGDGATHFSYIWSPTDARSIASMFDGFMPEIHIWVALTKPERAIVDFSTHGLRAQAEQMGFAWRHKDPPDFVFGVPPADVHYTPHPQAIAYTIHFMRQNLVLV